MAVFSYRAFDGDGVLQAGSMEASNVEAVASHLSALGLLPFEVTDPAARPSAWWQADILARRRLSHSALAGFTRELGTLVGAHLALDEALRLIAQRNDAARELARHLEEGVRAGRSLSQLLEAKSRELPPYYCAMIRAGESGGSLGPVLEELARLLERSQLVATRITSALIYPSVLFAMAGITMGVVIAVLVPNLLPLFEGRRGELPMLLSLLVALQAIVAGYWPWLLALSAFLVIGCIMLVRGEAVQIAMHRLLLILPVFGPIVRASQASRFSRTLATLLRGGVPLPNALQIAQQVVTNRVILRAVGRLETGVREGASLSSLLGKGPFPTKLVQLAAVGERAGRLEDMLSHAATMFEEELGQRIDRAMSLVSPAITLVLGLGVGGLVMSIMEAILSVNEIAL